MKAKPSTLRLKSASVVPDRMITKLKYHDDIIFTSGAVRTVNVFRGNSLFDPDQTNVGHQPLGFDQWSSFYSKYRVYASKIVCKFVSQEETVPLFIIVVPLNDNTTPSTDAGFETAYAKTATMTGYQAKGEKTVTNYMATAKIKSIKSIEYSEQYSALISASPAQEWFWYVICGSVDRTATPDAMAEITITYYCELFDRINLAVS